MLGLQCTLLEIHILLILFFICRIIGIFDKVQWIVVIFKSEYKFITHNDNQTYQKQRPIFT